MQEIIDDFRDPPKNKFRLLFIFLSLIYLLMSVLGYAFKIMHWPGADFLLFFGFAGLAAHSEIYAIFKTDFISNKIFSHGLALFLAIMLLIFYKFNWSIMPPFLSAFGVAFGIGVLLRK
ncbi:MAG: hypothetical protein PSX81_05950 [bacterium]|nr:hypothetical protein [bacterium]